MIRDPVDIAMEWDGVGPLGPVWQELARRMGASERPVRRIAVAGLDDRGRRTLASLLKLQRLPAQSIVNVDTTKIGAALGLTSEEQLRRLVQRVQGPVGNRAAVRAAAVEARGSLWSLASQRIGTRVPATFARIRGAGVPDGDVDAHAHTLVVLAESLDRLPSSSPIPLPVLAWQVSGDPHALDANTMCGRYLQFAAVELTGGSIVEPESVAVRRALRSLGVVVDRLSSTTITYGLRAAPDSPIGSILEGAFSMRMPINISGALLDAATPKFLQRRWLCIENPSVLEWALLAGYTGPIVCTSGWPSSDTQRLLELARDQGIELDYAGDYDSAGLAIANLMSMRFQVRVLMTTGVYLAADLGRAPDWGNASVPPTPWDPGLANAIRDKRRVVYQEDPVVWRELMKREAAGG